MVRYMLDISLEPHDNRIHGSKTRFKPWHREVMGTLRPLADLAFSDPRQFVVDASSPRAPELFAALADLLKRKVVKPIGGLRITEQLLDDEDRQVEWFEVAPVPLTGYDWVSPKPILLFAQLPPDRKEWPVLNRYAMRTIKASEAGAGAIVRADVSSRLFGEDENERLPPHRRPGAQAA
jgi:hypothetical protein